MSKNWDSKGIKPFSKYVMDKMKVWNRYQCSHLNKMQCQQSGHDVKVQFRYVSYKHPEKILFFPNSIKKKKKNLELVLQGQKDISTIQEQNQYRINDSPDFL